MVKKKQKPITKVVEPTRVVKQKYAEYVVDKKLNPTFCCICKKVKGTLKILDGNPSYRNRPICKVCNDERKLLRETK